MKNILRNLPIFILFLPNILSLMPKPMVFKKYKRAHCLSVPKLPLRFKEHIKSCQKEVQASVANDLFENVIQKNPFEVKVNKNPSNLHHNIYNLKYHKKLHPMVTPISYQNIKFIPNFQYSIPQRIPHLFYQHQHNLNSIQDYQINHIPQDEEVTYKYSDLPESDQEIQFLHQKYEAPQSENYAEFSTRDFHQPEQQEPLIFVTTEANYRYSDEITTDDEDNNEIIEARDELMKILGPKVVERREIFSGTKNNETSSSMETKKRVKRSFLTLWGYSAESSGRNEQLEVQDEEKNSKEDEEENFFSGDDKWLAGCLVQCIFHKNKAIDRLGYPTLDGIVDMYTIGTFEQYFFMYTLRAANKCLKTVSSKYKINRKKKPAKGLTCTVAYDVFDCVTDAVNAYCKNV